MIRKNRHNIYLVGNTFNKNSVVKGLVYIENTNEF